MLLDLEDERVLARIRRLGGDRVRLTLEYPAEPRYREAVFAALAELLLPSRMAQGDGAGDAGGAR